MPFFVRTPTGRLKLPKNLKKLPEDQLDTSGTTVNWCGMPVPKIGDYVHIGNGVSAGTVGRLISTKDFGQKANPNHSCGLDYWWSGEVETLAGTIEHSWIWGMTPLTAEAVQEVKDFYIQNGRPERIKVDW